MASQVEIANRALTKIGEARILALSDDVEAARQMVRGLDATPRGDLRVAAPILFGRLHVLPVVEALLAANPDLAVQLTLSDRNVHLVEDGVDVAVRIGDLADSSLISTRLGSVSRVLAASARNRACNGCSGGGSQSANRGPSERTTRSDRKSVDSPKTRSPRLAISVSADSSSSPATRSSRASGSMRMGAPRSG